MMALVGMKRKSEAALFVFLQMILMIEGMVHHHDFILTEKNFTRSCVTKRMLVVNGQFPGPTLYVRRGDVVFINVQNNGNSGVTIHWHGVKQPRNPWSDGPNYVTQCVIQPGKNFTYEVIFSTEEGTLWWHAHNEWTRNTVHGAIVIYPAEGSTAPYSTPFGEQILILGSWYNFDVNLVVEEDSKTGAMGLPISNKYLINGLPGNLFSVCPEDETFHWVVDYNKTYLLRIVSAVMNVELFFSIAGHNLTVVGTDGHYVKPFVTNYIMISPGQTLDVLVTTNQPMRGKKYYMVARQFVSTMQTDSELDLTNTTAILEYNNPKDGDKVGIIFPNTLPSHSDFVSAYHFIGQFRSITTEAYPIDVPVNITTRMFVTISMNILPYDNGGNYSTGLGASLNNVSWTDKEIDILQAYYRNMSGIFTDDFPDQPPTYYNFSDSDSESATVRGTKVKMLNYNEQVEVVFQGTNVLKNAQDHPIHLHGHTSYRVGFGMGTFDPLNDPMSYNLIDPPVGNTFTVPSDGWSVVRFKANNPGVWLLHCHYDKHLSEGMNTVFITKNGDTPESIMMDPPSHMPSCTSYQPITFGQSSQI